MVSQGAGAYFAYERFKKGKYLKGVGELCSGAACCFTEVGTLVSTGLNAAMAVDDTKQAIDATHKQQAEEQNQQQQKPVEKGVWDKFTDWFSR